MSGANAMFRRTRRVHFVGIGGIGMCGIAELLHAEGVAVRGSDLQEGPTVARLRSLGIEVAIGHDAAHVGDADVLVYSSAVRASNPELVEAKRRGIPAIRRAEMLAELMRMKQGIAIAGTHGKTTTTSLVAHVLSAAGLDPTAIVGGRVRGASFGATTRRGAGAWLVAEADESDGSFLRLAPVVAVVTNVEPEHLDHWGDERALRDAFADFANRVPFWGAAIVCLDDPGVRALLPRLERRVTTYGTDPRAHWVASDVRADGYGVRFRVARAGAPQGEAFAPLVGAHNALNALAAIAVADELEVPFAKAAEALTGFGGVERRFEIKGAARGITVVDDYGHHPTEVRATLAAARGVHAGRIVTVFQPHRYSRTRDLFDDFARAFDDADVLVLTAVYGAGEDRP
ncbi:MAG: UDP-N-acetylmuramate--L-alanine ligase, partial [Myxococcales bacterium]|nr:UDP-N-acetylmuramate--L-alanine ligase [Myxococcales bacterium]